jgi:hypothetical protein
MNCDIGGIYFFIFPRRLVRAYRAHLTQHSMRAKLALVGFGSPLIEIPPETHAQRKAFRGHFTVFSSRF